jgi:hypothetical protein
MTQPKKTRTESSMARWHAAVRATILAATESEFALTKVEALRCMAEAYDRLAGVRVLHERLVGLGVDGEDLRATNGASAVVERASREAHMRAS